MRKHTRGVVALLASSAAALAPAIAGPSDAGAATVAASTAVTVAPNGPVPVRPTVLFATTRRVAVYAGRTRAITVLGHARVPNRRVDAVRIVVSVRATRATRVSVWPAGSRAPRTATVSAPARTRVSKTVIVRIGTRGAIDLVSSTTGASVSLTVTGYVTTPNLRFTTPETPWVANRLLFNNIKNNTGGTSCPPNHYSCVKSTGVVRVTNTGTSSTRASFSVSDRSRYSVSPSSVLIAPRASANVTVRFFGTPATGLNVQVETALLRWSTSDHKAGAVSLIGLAQRGAGEPSEPKVPQIVNTALGLTGIKFGTLDQGSGVYRTHPGSTEVNAPYFRPVGSTVSVRELAKWTNTGASVGVPKTISWAAKTRTRPYTGGPVVGSHAIATDSAAYNQAILPTPNGRAITGSFRPGGVFQFLVGGDYGDDVANVAWHSRITRWNFCGGVHPSQRTPCPYGHVIKAFPVPGHANTYILIHDDSGVNLDYNDEIWVVSGVQPVQSGWAGYVK